MDAKNSPIFTKLDHYVQSYDAFKKAFMIGVIAS